MLSPHIQPGTSLPKPAHCAVSAWAGITSSHLIPLAHSSHPSKRSNKSFFVFVASLAQQGKSISGIVFARLPVPGIAGAAVVLLRVMLLCSMPWEPPPQPPGAPELPEGAGLSVCLRAEGTHTCLHQYIFIKPRRSRRAVPPAAPGWCSM